MAVAAHGRTMRFALGGRDQLEVAADLLGRRAKQVARLQRIEVAADRLLAEAARERTHDSVDACRSQVGGLVALGEHVGDAEVEAAHELRLPRVPHVRPARARIRDRDDVEQA